MNAHRAAVLAHPEAIHPALWRGSQLGMGRQNAIATGFSALDAELPNHGWPVGALVDVALSQPGIGELRLLQPALSRLDTTRSIALIAPPHTPYFHCWVNWQLGNHRLWWINPHNSPDALWAAEQILRHNTCAALICWAAQLRPDTLRRLHLAAQQSDTLLFALRPHFTAQQPCIAPLRLSLSGIEGGLEVVIAKRRGPTCNTPIPIMLYPWRSRTETPTRHHASLDQSVLAATQSRRAFSVLAH